MENLELWADLFLEKKRMLSLALIFLLFQALSFIFCLVCFLFFFTSLFFPRSFFNQNANLDRLIICSAGNEAVGWGKNIINHEASIKLLKLAWVTFVSNPKKVSSLISYLEVQFKYPESAFSVLVIKSLTSTFSKYQ